ncbi:uncharacterized protein LOC130759782 [Actinidia eriantha]|uniref:uncharacterized protein LOC130759782 n=1 Tax=Actinidia eriantha TaxID=165200 RepID=UPI00258E5117|nr:uncharacterized protein LOC130759782 [Actinidia eriantha]
MASIPLLVVVFVFDLVAFALALLAEQRRAKTSFYEDANGRYCIYEPEVATNLGVASLVLLLASQLLIMVATRCLCCGKALTPGTSRSLAIPLFISCWVTFIIAEICLMAGTVENGYHSRHPPCKALRKGVFGSGAAFVIFTGIISELYYVYYSKATDDFVPDNVTELRMGIY